MRVRVLGVPSAWGASDPGVAGTPARLRKAGLLDWLAAGDLAVEDGDDVAVPPRAPSGPSRAPGASARPSSSTPAPGARADGPAADATAVLPHLAEVVAVAVAVRAAVESTLDDGWLPLLLGGECGLAVGAVAGLGRRRGRPRVAWLDAHGDLNTPETSASGLLTGMPLAALLGHGAPDLTAVVDTAARPRPARAWLLGGRDLDPPERAHIEAWGLRHLDTMEVRERGPEEVVAAVLEAGEALLLPPAAAPQGRPPDDGAGRDVYLHVDVDAVDPDEAPGVAFPVPGGFRAEEVADLAGYVGVSGRLGAVALASASLEHDREGRTVEVIRRVVASLSEALGQAAATG